MPPALETAMGVDRCVSNRQVKPEAKIEMSLLLPKNHQRAAFRLSSNGINMMENPAPQDDVASLICMCASVRAHVLRHAPIRGAVSFE